MSKIKFEPYSPKWEKAANAVARDFVLLGICADCKGPHVKGYVCTHCGSSCPEGGC